MATIVSIHSFRGGTGKSNLAANIAWVLARQGRRVGVIDTDIQSPGVHAIFGLNAGNMQRTLNDYLLGRADISEVAHPLGGPSPDGRRAYLQGLDLWLIPSSIQASEIAQVLQEGYDVGLLNDGFYQLADQLALDVLIIDTHPGLNEETLLSIAISDVLCIIMRPDEQDLQGTAVTVDIARKLEVPSMLMVVNKVPARLDRALLQQDVEASFGVPVACLLALSEDVAFNASAEVFAAVQPAHPWSQAVTRLALQIDAEGQSR